MEKCTLDGSLHSCRYYQNGDCSNLQGCSFQQREQIKQDQNTQKKYVRPERWYAKYTMGVRNQSRKEIRNS